MSIFFVEVTVCIDRIKTAFSAFLRGSPRAVPHGGRQEGSAETRASFLQEWRAGGRQSGTTSLPGKVTNKKKCYHTDSGSCSRSSSRNVNAVSVHSVGSPVISASQTPCRSWSTRAKPPLSRPVSPSSRGHPSWPLTPTCSAMRKQRLMWVSNHDDECASAICISNEHLWFLHSLSRCWVWHRGLRTSSFTSPCTTGWSKPTWRTSCWR